MKDLLYEPAGLVVRAELLPQRCSEESAVLNFVEVALQNVINNTLAAADSASGGGGCRLSETGKIRPPADREE
jgi:hypothetical protein